jgi:hypothetical protein
MTTGKRAAAHELQEKKVNAYTLIIRELISRVQKDPLTDYSGELNKLYKVAPKDRGLIRLAEQEAYIQVQTKDHATAIAQRQV